MLFQIRIIDRLEEIGVTATKEFALETAMAKMKAEWQSFCFECVPYRKPFLLHLYAANATRVLLPKVLHIYSLFIFTMHY